VIGVDHQQGMLDTFAATAERRGLAHTEVLGDWPDSSDRTPATDVVVSGEVRHGAACGDGETTCSTGTWVLIWSAWTGCT